MTAVEFLVQQILKHDKSFIEFYNAEIQQALEMEKQQKEKMYSEEDLKEAFAMGRLKKRCKDFNQRFKKDKL
jgi:hypothetical protein